MVPPRLAARKMSVMSVAPPARAGFFSKIEIGGQRGLNFSLPAALLYTGAEQLLGPTTLSRGRQGTVLALNWKSGCNSALPCNDRHAQGQALRARRSGCVRAGELCFVRELRKTAKDVIATQEFRAGTPAIQRLRARAMLLELRSRRSRTFSPRKSPCIVSCTWLRPHLVSCPQDRALQANWPCRPR